MRPHSVGRALGIGARLLGQRVTAPPPQRTEEERRAVLQARARQGEALGQGVRRIPQGSRAFGRAVFTPVAHAGRVLWLEITGAFFALFAVLFVQHLWAIRAAWRSGPERAHFWTYAALALMFAWFAGSSFVRSRRRS